MNQLTAKHLDTCKFCFLILPQALLTMIGGVLAFLTTTIVFNDDATKTIPITI